MGEWVGNQDIYSRFRGLRMRVTLLKSLTSCTGWITDLTSENALLTLDGEFLSVPGDEAFIEVHGLDTSLHISAAMAGEFPGAVVFNVHSIRTTQASEAPRKKAEHIRFELSAGLEIVKGEVNDISEGGIGIVCTVQLEVDREYPIKLQTPIGETRGSFRVRHIGGRNKAYEYRVGGTLTVADRVDQARWRSLVQKRLAA